MLAMDLGPGGHFSLILGGNSLLVIPPGTATVEIISNVRRAGDGHGFRQSIAQIFYF